MNIAISIDDGYTKYAYVMLVSLFEHNKDVCVYVLTEDVSQENRKTLEDLGKKYNSQVRFIDIKISDELKAKLPLNAWKIQVYYRLLLADVLPEEVKRIIYLDTDMIVRASIRELYEINLGKNVICACGERELTEEFFAYRGKEFEELYRNKMYPTFNSGCVLMDIEKMRGKYTFSYYIKVLEELNYKVYTPDQDLLNYVHHNEVLVLSSDLYNYEACKWYGNYYEKKKDRIKILHYILGKPWQANHIPFYIERIWWDYAKKTPYFDEFRFEYERDAERIESYRNRIENIEKSIIQSKNALDESVNVYIGILEIYKKVMSPQWVNVYGDDPITVFGEKNTQGREIYTYFEIISQLLGKLSDYTLELNGEIEKIKMILDLDGLG